MFCVTRKNVELETVRRKCVAFLFYVAGQCSLLCECLCTLISCEHVSSASFSGRQLPDTVCKGGGASLLLLLVAALRTACKFAHALSLVYYTLCIMIDQCYKSLSGPWKPSSFNTPFPRPLLKAVLHCQAPEHDAALGPDSALARH